MYSTKENTKVGDIISSFKGTSKIGMVANFTPKGISCYWVSPVMNDIRINAKPFFTDIWVHVVEDKLSKVLQDNIKQFRKDRNII